jgi:3-dehydroquinate dehydratase II
MNVLVLHGPNLNLLGERLPEIYGGHTLAEVNKAIRRKARSLSIVVRIFQSNHEGTLIDRIHAERKWMQALVINAGALTHYSYALRDAIEATHTRAIEVHLSDISRREPWRRKSVIAEVCEGQIAGKGIDSYLEALRRLANSPAI